MSRVIFGIIENNSRPIGGVKVIFQAVALLRRRGIDAYVAAPSGVPAWLRNNPLIRDASILDVSVPKRFKTDDLYIATDALDANRLRFMRSRTGRKIIFFQNHNALRSDLGFDWRQFHHVQCLTVSQHSRDILKKSGFDRVAVIPPGIDRTVFRPAQKKRHRLCYMSRKWPDLAAKLRARIGEVVDWIDVDSRPESEVADLLATASIFVNFGRNEGFGLPPLEAMASGCLVAGFAGQGTLEYANRRNGIWVREGDFDACVTAVRAALALVEEERHLRGFLRAGMATATRYDVERFGDSLADFVRSGV